MSVLGSVARWVARHKWWIVGGAALVAAVILGPPVVMYVSTSGERFAAGDPRIPKRDVALVFGAGVQPDGNPTPYLKRRLDSAIDLYKSGTVKVLLLSGDNRTIHYNEPIAMQRYVVSQGVPEEDAVLDYAGFNTYDSCYRARAIFNVKRAIVVSQAYHLPRAVWTCGHVGVESIGVSAKPAGTGSKDYTINYLIREIGSSDKAMIQTIFKPKPTFLGKFEPIEGIE
ncbi:YdcF family protein [Candidatus Saccharibacteria bacterium]|nr:YdcF family protein [Candidatus Saccharibacteria bacterium]